jgi:hypothetical protein
VFIGVHSWTSKIPPRLLRDKYRGRKRIRAAAGVTVIDR